MQYTTNILLQPVSSFISCNIYADFYIKKIIPITFFRFQLPNFYLISNTKSYKNVVLYAVRSCKLGHIVIMKSIEGI